MISVLGSGERMKLPEYVPSRVKETLAKVIVSLGRKFGTMLKTYTADPVKFTVTSAGACPGL